MSGRQPIQWSSARSGLALLLIAWAAPTALGAEPEPEPEPASAAGETKGDPDAADGDDDDGLRTEKWFKKGELASVGALSLVPWDNRVGLRVDLQRSANAYYLAVTPIVTHTLEIAERDLVMSFGVPLRILLWDEVHRFDNAGRFRVEDWDQPVDYVKLLRHITYGRKEDHFYVNVSSFSTATIGHGTLLRRFNPNIALDMTRVSVELDAFTDWIGAQTYMDHIAPPSVVGGLLFIKPLSFVNRDDYRLRSFSLGLSLIVDLDAPLMNRLDVYDADGDGRRGELLLGGQDRRIQSVTTPLFAYGIDAELKVYKSPDKTVDIKAYVDYSFLTGQVPRDCAEWSDADQAKRCQSLFENDPVNVARQPSVIETEAVTSGGFSAGLLGRFTIGDKREHALRLRGEFRTYDGNYTPSYFDTMYQVHRVQYGTARDDAAVNPANPTKMRRILERDPSRVYGFHAELTYQYWGVFELGLGLSMNTRTDDNALFVHIGVPKNKYFSFFISYMKTAAAPEDLFDPRRNTIVIGQARVFLTPFLHLYAGAITPFGLSGNDLLEQFFDITAGLELSLSY